MGGSLKLPDSPETKLWRKVVTVAKANGMLKDAVRTWFIWDGGAPDRMEPSPEMCPSLALVPVKGADSFYTPSGFASVLSVQVTCTVAGTNVDDLLNLYHAVRKAFWPADDATRTAIRSGFLALGARTGEVLMTGPAYSMSLDTAGMSTAVGALALELEIQP